MPSPKTIPHALTETASAEAAPMRRRFLMGAAVAAAAAGTAAATSHLVPPQPASTNPAAEPADDTAAGYRLTEHIRKYYRTTWI